MIAATTPAEKTSRNTRPAAGTLKRRAHDLLEMEIGFISNPLFTETNAEAVVFEKDFDLDVAPEVHLKAGSKLPSHLARLCDAPLLDGDEEHHLFRRMNYCRFKASSLRSKLNRSRPSRTKLDEIDDLLAEADAVMHRIVAANVRLVISIVKQLAGSSNMFDELLSDGLLAMLRAVEKFDFDRGFRFSTYATMVIRRQLYRSMKNDHRDRTRFPIGDQQLLSETPEADSDPRIGYQGWVELNQSLVEMLTSLDDRERLIIRARFGFDTGGKKQTLQSLASEFGVCKERVRQLEKRAMTKLRTLAEDAGLESLIEPEFV